MSIDPTSPKPLSGPRPEPGHGKQVREGGDVRIGVPRPDSRNTASTNGDQVELSREARASGASQAGSSSGLSTSRLREVLQRLTSGFYDTAQVRDTVARRIRAEQGL